MARLLSPTIQNLYAQILDLLLSSQEALSHGRGRGSLKVRANKGHEYAYWQYRDIDGAVRHRYLGAMKDPGVRKRVEAIQASRAEFAELKETIRPLVRAWVAGGGMTPPQDSYRILAGLSEAGLFSQGAVLVGTPAFLGIGNQRGINWGAGRLQTQDLDIAASNDIKLVFPGDPTIDIPAIMKSMSNQFHEVPGLDVRQPSVAWKLSNSELMVDFLTPGPRVSEPPKPIARWQQAAYPLWNLGYLIDEATTEAAMIGRNGAFLVRLPDAARFAIHKLFVAAERPSAFAVKARKDLLQAEALIGLLRSDGEEDLLTDALRAAQAHPGLLKRALRSASRLTADRDWLVEQLRGALEAPLEDGPGLS